MGGIGLISLVGSREEVAVASRAAVAEVGRIEARYSRFRPDSFLSAINRAAKHGESIEVDDETAGLLDYAFACFEKSGGLFDITSGLLRRAWNFSAGILPEESRISTLMDRIGMEKISWVRPNLSFGLPGMELDLGGIGKEYAADRCVEICLAHGISGGLVNLGGDIAVVGPQLSGEPWSIEVQNPFEPASSVASVPVASGGLATSGDYERGMTIEGLRYGHLLDPRTGWPVHGLASVTVLGPTCLVAGSVASIGMLMGLAGADWLETVGLPYGWVDADGRREGELFRPH